jgi:hypothetical protein
MMTRYERFTRWVRVDPVTGCWLWEGLRSTDGYGKVTLNKRSMRAHRAVWELTRGPIPEGMFVLHRCDTPLCVNPEHLFVGSQKENRQDCARKGRTARGSGHFKTALTADGVMEIRRLVSRGRPPREVADQFGISVSSVGNLAARRSWKHVG